MRVTIFDYGAGNLHSLAKALTLQGTSLVVETDPIRATDTDLLILPGVGAFSAASARIGASREHMRAVIMDGLPTLGICLGMQLLLEGSDEGAGAGLGVIAGRVTRLRATRVPQIGWNVVDVDGDSLAAMPPLAMAYYANSFVCRPDDRRCVIAWSTHESDRFPAVIRPTFAGSRTLGVQFHPEKSSADGVRFLHAFVRSVREEMASR